MIRMSKLADYAFVILSQMMAEPEQNWSASTLSSETDLPLPTVAKLMKLLAKGNIVSAQRGATGGYKMDKDPELFSIVDVIESVDGPIGLTECSCQALGQKPKKECVVNGTCPNKENWARVNNAFMAALKRIRLAEFAPKEEETAPKITAVN